VEFVPILVLGTLIKKLIDWLRVLIDDDLETKILIPLSGVVGAVVVFLFSLSPELSEEIEIWPGHFLADASLALVIIYGLVIGIGMAGVIHDLVKPTTPPHDSLE
jgi:fructose-specific phosphotransferase system IIC component